MVEVTNEPLAPVAATGLTPSARTLLNAFTEISSDLALGAVLDRVVRSACELTGARYGAIGVIGGDGELSDFVTWGLSRAETDRIGQRPTGKGLLSALTEHPHALRLTRLQDHPRSLGYPENHPVMTSFLGVPVRIRGTVFGNLYLCEKMSGAPFTSEDELLVQALATAAGFVVENARAFELSERRRRWLEASVRMSETLQPPIALPQALQQIAIAARRVMDAQATMIVQRSQPGRYTLSAADGPQTEPHLERLERLTKQLMRCEENGEHEVISDGVEHTLVLLPLRAQLASSGVLVVLLDSSRGELESEERELLTTFVDHASLGLDRARAVEDRSELAVASDRERIARDLHDVVIQQIFATGMQLRVAGHLSTTQVVIDRIDESVTALDATIRDIRSTISDLQSRERPSLRAEARAVLEEYVPVLGFTPTLRTVGRIDIVVPPDLVAHLLAVLREALSNVARHAGASVVSLEIQALETDVLLRIVDNGVGLAAQGTESGLLKVRRRARELGGTVRLHATRPHGTTMEWRVPLPATVSPLPSPLIA